MLKNRYWIAIAVLAIGLALLVFNDESGSVFGIDSNVFASTLVLGVLGASLAAGIVRSGTRLGDAARSAAIWLAILVALVGSYQYRYELQDVASRLTAGLVPGSPISLQTADGATTVQLDKLANGHFGARGEVDGRPVSFIVDTGATATVLTAADAARAGFDTGALRFDIPVSTANGRGRAARVNADELRVGSIARGPMRVLVAEAGALDQSLLGMDFIGRLSGFDVRGDRMILRD